MNVDADELMARWPHVVRYVVSRVGSYAVAEDIAGETFLRAVTSCKLDDRPNALSNWLLTVAGRLAIDWARRQKRRRSESLDVVDFRRGVLDVGSDRHAASLDVRAAVDALPERVQDIVRVTTTGDYSQKEYAAAHGMSKTEVCRRAGFGRADLRARLGADYAQ